MDKTVISIIMLAFAVLGFACNVHAEEPDCIMCHSDKSEGKSLHPAVTMGCSTCHSGVNASKIPHKFTSGISKGLMAEGGDLCFMCHDKDKFAGKTSVHMPVAGGMCTSCHNPHSSQYNRLLKADFVCFDCHDKSDFEGKAKVHPPVLAQNCLICHGPHQSENEKLLLYKTPDICYTCHDKTQFFATTVHPPVSLGMCSTCHNPHQSDNDKLLTEKDSALCYICHDKANFSKGGSVHKPVSEGQCSICHMPHAGPNEALVYRKGNILCRKCHSEIEKKAHVVSGFSSSGHPTRGRKDPNRQGKTFECLSCHVPHTSDSKYLFRFKASAAFELCTYCHEM